MVEPGVAALVGEQFFVRTVLANPPVGRHRKVVDLVYRTEAVRDQDTGASLFRLSICGSRWHIQDQQIRLAQEQPGQRNPLPLAARQINTPSSAASQ